MKGTLKQLSIVFALGAVLLLLKQRLFAQHEQTRVYVESDQSSRADTAHLQRQAALAQAAIEAGLGQTDPIVLERLRASFPDEASPTRLYRRALSMQLFQRDALLQARLALLEELALGAALPVAEPSQRALASYYAQHAERYARPMRVSFVQLLVTRERHGEAALAHAHSLRKRLEAAALDEPAAAAMGEPSNLPRELRHATLESVRSRFGGALADALETLPEQQWSPPIPSALGYHLVWLVARQPGHTRPLSEVQPRVRADYLAEQRCASLEQRVAQLRRRYHVELLP